MDTLTNKLNSVIINKFKSLFVIYLLTFISFSNIFQNQFILDDFKYIRDWPLIQNLNNFPLFFLGISPEGQDGIYAPLKTLFHSIAYSLFKSNVFGYHCLSLLIHFIAILIVYKIIYTLTRNPLVTFLTTLFFALHPVHCEAISLMTQSIDTIGSVFLLVAFYFYIKTDTDQIYVKKRYYYFSLIFCFLAILSRELTASLPFLLTLYDLTLRKTKTKWKTTLLRILPFFLIVLIYLLCKYFLEESISRGNYIYGSFYLTMLISIKAIAKYLYIMIFPITLSFDHIISKGIYSIKVMDFDKSAVLSQSLGNMQILLSLLVIGICVFTFFYFRKNKPIISFSIGWFFISLLPASNLIPCGVFFAERYLYFASIGFCLLLGLFFNYVCSQKNKNNVIEYHPLIIIIICLLCVGYGLRTWLRNRDFHDQVAFLESTVRTNPQSVLMRNKLEQAKYKKEENKMHSFTY